MTNRNFIATTATTVVLAVPVFLSLITPPLLRAQAPQSPAVPQWQTGAGGKMEFDVASVKQNKSSDPRTSNVALGPGDYYSPNGGLFTATNTPLLGYILFAYKVSSNQLQTLLSQLPKWVTTEKFDIQARAESNPTKDQMRLMVQSLLADRFKLAIHSETRQLPAYALVLVSPGKTGPQLQAHPNDTPCSTDPKLPSTPSAVAPATVAAGYPIICGGIQTMQPSAPGRVRAGGRNVTMELIATNLAVPGGADRPVFDKTGLSGAFDFTLEWAPQINSPNPTGADAQPEVSGPTFLEALRTQLGLKLESQTGPVDVLVVDHIEEPSPN